MPASLTAFGATHRLFQEIEAELSSLEHQGLRRQLRVVERLEGARVRVEDRELVCWCSNDYLGLARHPRVVRAASEAAARWGVGAGASRLLAGTSRCHAELEQALADWFGTQAAAVFASGYLANLGCLGSLLAAGDAVFVDRLAHASLVDAARSTRAAFRVFAHNDLEQLDRLLRRPGRPARRRVIVTEGVFSMDGDRAPLAALADLAQRHGCLVYLDDAHGAFVLGASGRGSCEAAAVAPEAFLYMGTLGKALGCQGGFVAGPQRLIELLHHRAKTFVYATALAVPVAAAAAEAIRVARDEPARRESLTQRAAQLAAALQVVGWPSHIVPVQLGSPERALAAARGLWDRGHWAPAIRPPTVPAGTSRLRISVTASHTPGDIESLADALKDVLRAEGVRGLEKAKEGEEGAT